MISDNQALLKSDMQGRYVTITENVQLFVIGDFLATECMCFGIDHYRYWALDAHRLQAGGNLTTLKKVDGRIRLSSDLFEGDENQYLYLSVENFLELLDVWEKMTVHKPQEIMLSIEDGRAKLEVLRFK